MAIGAIPGTPFQVQCKNESITTDSQGRATITYTDAFPVQTNTVFVTIEGSTERSVAVDTLAKTGFRLTCSQKSDTFNLMWYAVGE